MTDNEKPGPVFVIPYSDGDVDNVINNSVQPIRSPDVWYVCRGIEHSDYTPGSSFRFRVGVGNFNQFGLTNSALVDVWLIEPGTVVKDDPDPSNPDPTHVGIRLRIDDIDAADPSQPHTIGAATRFTDWTEIQIDASASRHQCLVARVQSTIDEAPVFTPALPGTDRHWAQENLTYVPASKDRSNTLEFNVGNPLQEFLPFEVVVSLIEDEAISGAISSYVKKGEFDRLDGVSFTVSEKPDDLSGRPSLRLSLDPGQSQKLFLNFQLAADVEPDRFGILQIVQWQRDRGDLDPNSGLVIGGIGVIVLPPE